MATFGKTTFSHSSYASFRPSYPPSLYQTVLSYHQGPRNLCVDLGCGHGLIARRLAKDFSQVIGTDPSRGMIELAKSLTPSTDYPNVEFEQASAESIPFLAEKSVDVVVAGQAAHWFDCPNLFKELKRVMRPGGSLAFWGYKDHVFVNYPKATKLLNHFAYGDNEHLLGPYWSRPGRSIVENKLQDIKPPTEEWDEIQRIEYEPGLKGPRSGEGTIFMEKKMTLEQCMDYIRTWSSFHGWQEKHPNQKKRSAGGNGDVVDEMFDAMVDSVEEWKATNNWHEKVVDVEWGTGLLLARKR